MSYDWDNGENGSLVREAVRTVLFAGSSISGRLSYDLPVKIDSRFSGEVKASDLLVVGVHAHLEARVAARCLQLEGRLIGSVQVAGCFEIMPGGHFQGEARVGELKVHPGAIFDGQGEITGKKFREAQRLDSSGVSRAAFPDRSRR